MPRKKTHEEFVNELAEKNPNIEVLGQYKNSKEKISLKCLKCGRSWSASPNNILSGSGCPLCAHPSARKTHNQFVEELSKVNPDILVIGQYKTIKDKIACHCLVCGYEWLPTAGSILNSAHGCPKCWEKRRGKSLFLTHEEFLEIFSKYPNCQSIETLGKYQASKKPIECRCIDCGHEWSPTPNSLLHGQGCPICHGHDSTSFMEQCFLLIMQNHFGKESVLSRDRKIIGKELDIVIPALKVAIEPGNWKWHKDKMENDLEKRNKCAEKGYRLFFVYDSVPSSVAVPFEIDCWTSTEDLGVLKNESLLKNIIGECCLELGFSITDLEWELISIQARRNSRRKNSKDFVCEMRNINPAITILSEYENSGKKIKCKCNICGNEWLATPSNLKSGWGCPKCRLKKIGDSHKLSNEDYLRKLALKNPTIEALEKYRGSKEPIKVKCKICGNIWSPQAGRLLQNHGCPKCGQETAMKKRTGPKKRKPVRCINTGIEYNSLTAAAKAVGLSNPSDISNACKNNKIAAGYLWEFTEPVFND